MSYEITAMYAAALGLLTAGLAFAIVIMRVKSDPSWGHGNNSRLERAIRAHGNLIEYMPIFLVIMMIGENSGVADKWLHILGLVFLVGRLFSVVYFWISPKLAYRIIAFWGSVLPIIAGAMFLLA